MALLPSHAYLESLGISFQTVTFPATTEKGAPSVARALGDIVTPRQVIKSLMFETSTAEVVLVLVGGDQNVISGCLKKVVSDRNVRMASRARIRDISGYEVGSIPPFSWQPPGFRTFIDASLLDEAVVAVGAGSWGNEILLTPADLVRASSAQPVNLTCGDVPAQFLPIAVSTPAQSKTHSPASPSTIETATDIEISKLRAHTGADLCIRYFLTSANLGFRCWSNEDLPLAMELWGDPDVNALIGGPFNEEMVRARLAQEIAQMQKCGLQYWPVFLLDDHRHVGCAGLRPHSAEQGPYELGVHLRRAFWGRGLAKEAARAVIDYAFGPLGAEALFAGHHPSNEASRQLLLKLGFVRTHEEFYPPTGLMHPSYLLRKT